VPTNLPFITENNALITVGSIMMSLSLNAGDREPLLFLLLACSIGLFLIASDTRPDLFENEGKAAAIPFCSRPIEGKPIR
jgi:hypothetical protein